MKLSFNVSFGDVPNLYFGRCSNIEPGLVRVEKLAQLFHRPAANKEVGNSEAVLNSAIPFIDFHSPYILLFHSYLDEEDQLTKALNHNILHSILNFIIIAILSFEILAT